MKEKNHMEPLISWNDFEKIRMFVGTVMAVADFPKARKPAWKLEIDFGPKLGIRKSSAQIKTFYTPEQLVGTQVIAVLNFPPKQIAGFMSECLVLGIYDENNDVILLRPQKPVSNGQPVG